MVDRLIEWWPGLVVAAALATTGVVVGRIGRGSVDERPRVPGDLGPFPAVLFFSSGACASCGPARALVAAEAGGLFREHAWDVHPGILGRLRVDRVPTTWVVDAGGRRVRVVEGVPTPGSVAMAVEGLRVPE